MDSQHTVQRDVDQLNSFLRGELSAVETYDQALGKIDNLAVNESLRQVRASHDRRVDLLRRRIQQLGGEPAKSSGVWGGFARLVEGGAAALGVAPAISALEEGEDHGKADYRSDLHDVSRETQTFLSTSIFPEQTRTHDIVSALKHQFKSAKN